MTTIERRTTVLRADQEHEGLRIAVPLLLLVGFCLGYLLLFNLLERALAGNALLDYAVVISCVAALPLGLAVAAGSEYLLKRHWPSGRRLVLTEDGLTLERPEGNRTLTWDRRTISTRWFFRLKGYARHGKERRVPTGWVCLAVQLQQDETRLLAFAFMQPKRAAACLDEGRFHEILPAEVHRKTIRQRLTMPSRPEIPPRLLTGKDGRYWLAERNRWLEGVELTGQDFETFMRMLKARELLSAEVA